MLYGELTERHVSVQRSSGRAHHQHVKLQPKAWEKSLKIRNRLWEEGVNGGSAFDARTSHHMLPWSTNTIHRYNFENSMNEFVTYDLDGSCELTVPLSPPLTLSLSHSLTFTLALDTRPFLTLSISHSVHLSLSKSQSLSESDTRH